MAENRSRRGGKRTPAKPAPVSGPGALSRRTDGGAGQPVRSFPAEFQGQRQMLEGLQQSAPLASQPSPPAPASPAGASQAGAASPTSIFGPTTRPNEAVTAGAFGQPQAPGLLPPDPDAFIRLLYTMKPDPYLLRLIRNRG